MVCTNLVTIKKERMKDVLRFISIIAIAIFISLPLVYFMRNYHKAPPYKVGTVYAKLDVFDTVYYRVERMGNGWINLTNICNGNTYSFYHYGRYDMLGVYDTTTKCIKVQPTTITEYINEFINLNP